MDGRSRRANRERGFGVDGLRARYDTKMDAEKDSAFRMDAAYARHRQGMADRVLLLVGLSNPTQERTPYRTAVKILP